MKRTVQPPLPASLAAIFALCLTPPALAQADDAAGHSAAIIYVEAAALEASDQPTLNDEPVQVAEPVFTSSPEPVMSEEPVIANPEQVFEPAAVTSSTPWTPPAQAPVLAPKAPVVTAPEPIPSMPAPTAAVADTARTAAARVIERPTTLPAAPTVVRPAPIVQPVATVPVVQDLSRAANPPSGDDDPFVINSILKIDGPIRYGEWFWDDEGVPAGPLVMTVDLEARVLSVFRGGHEIGAAAVLLGTQKHPTPLGTFPILTKEKDNVSEKYDNAPMPYTLRLTWDGIAIHGSQVENGYASHGCIGAPDEFAARLFDIAKKGDKVIITRGKMATVGDPLLES